MNEFSRQCKWCEAIVFYTTRTALRYAEKHNSKCKNCRRIGTTHSEDTKRYLSQLKLGTHLSEDTKEKIGNACRGVRNYWYGKHHSEESRQKMSEWHCGKVLSISHRQHISEANKGNKHTVSYKRKMSKFWKGRVFSSSAHINMRKAAIRRVINQFGTTSYNKLACRYIDKLNADRGWNLQHAENGGEVEICGYLVDGYDKDRNIVFEYDERQHFTIGGKLRLRDLRRQKDIINHIGCRFYRYNSLTKTFYKVI